MSPSPFLEDLTWPEVAAAAEEGVPVVLPVGAIEQHGPHLPLATDCILPVAVAKRAAERTRLLIAPPVRYGAPSRPLSGGGEGFPGTLSLRGITLMRVVSDVVSALGRSNLRNICVLNWHYENAGYLWEACDNALAESPGTKIVLLESPMPPLDSDVLAELFPEGFAGWDVEHAAAAETSMMLVVRPDLVRRDEITDDAAKRRPSWDVLPPPPEFIPDSGVLWRASDATERLGERLLELSTAYLLDAVITEFAS